MVQVLAPVSGLREDVTDIPDPVFARGIVGPGAAITPHHGKQCAVAPIDGTVVKLYPHAFLIHSDKGPSVLVHLGIDTCHMHGAGFTMVVEENQRVRAGAEIIRWDPDYVEETGHSPICAVVVLDCPYQAVPSQPNGSEVTATQPLFSIDC
jgi:PTS system N-acetylglucosamine-specific IIA component